ILEQRWLPTVTANLVSGTLTVTLGAAGDTATLTGTTTAGTTIQVAGTGFTTNIFSPVTAITVQDGGSNASQSVTLTSTGTNAIVMSGKITITGIETVTLSTSTTLQASSFSEGGATTGVNLNANVTTTGLQLYNNAVTLGTSVSLATNATLF